MSTNFAQQLVTTLENLGVKRIYGLVGDSLNPLSNAVRTSSIEWIHVRNEEAAAFAAALEAPNTYRKRVDILGGDTPIQEAIARL